jgi:hypothetical protein
MRIINFILLFMFLTANLQAALLLDFNHYNARLYGSSEALLVETADINNLEIFPASIAGIYDNELSTGYISSLNSVSIFKFNYGRHLGPDDVLAGSVNFADFKLPGNYDSSGNLLGSLRNSDFSVNAAYAIKLGKHVQLGAGIKYLGMNIGDFNGNWLGFGFSALVNIKLPGINILNDNFNFGAGIQNLSIIKTRFEEQESSFTAHINAGFIYQAFQIHNFTGKIGSTLDLITAYNQTLLSVGLELGWNELIFIRAGVPVFNREYDTVNVGVGFQRQLTEQKVVFKFDYSTGFIGDVQNHYIQLGVGF